MNVGQLCRRLIKTNYNRQNFVLKVRLFNSTKPEKPKSSGVVKLSLLGITAGALVGTGYSLHKLNEPKGHIINEATPLPLLEKIPEIEPSRRVCYVHLDPKIVQRENGGGNPTIV